MKFLHLIYFTLSLSVSHVYAETTVKKSSEMTLVEFNRQFDILDSNDTEYEDQLSVLDRQLSEAVAKNDDAKKNLTVFKTAGTVCRFLNNTREVRKLISEYPDQFKQKYSPKLQTDIIENINDRETYLVGWLEDFLHDKSVTNVMCKDFLEKIK